MWIFSGIILAPELISTSNSSYHFRVKIEGLGFSNCLLDQGSMIVKSSTSVNSLSHAQYTSSMSSKVLATWKGMKEISSLYFFGSNFLKLLLIVVLGTHLGHEPLVIAYTRWWSLISGLKAPARKNFFLFDVKITSIRVSLLGVILVGLLIKHFRL